jgi:NAD(P)-dependent dehydrogenase (short-subunit alcohol dehydrogenase family)
MDLDGKVAIVTGASRGIGRQIALALAARGVAVVVAARTVDPHAHLPGSVVETVAAIEAAGGRALAVRTDVTAEADLAALVAITVETFGRIDVLVNNAADTHGASAPIDEYPRDAWLRQFDANVHAPFSLIALVVPHLRRTGGGAIVNITSGQGDLVPPDPDDKPYRLGSLLGYATTKAALNRLANALAPELRPDSIAIVNVDPGLTRTEYVDHLAERGLVDLEAAQPMEATASTVVKLLAGNLLERSGQIVRVREDAA